MNPADIPDGATTGGGLCALPSGNSLFLLEIFSREAGAFFHDPWPARDASIRLLRDSSPESIRKFFRDHATRALDPEEQQKALALLEMARQGLAMQTSCAWFFDDIADREAVQVLRFAARAIQIARDQTGTLLEQAFIQPFVGNSREQTTVS